MSPFRKSLLIQQVKFSRLLPAGNFEVVFSRQRREFCVRLALIPERCRRNIRLLIVVASVVTPAEVLNRNTQVLIEANRVEDMPAIKPECRYGTIQPVGTNHLVHSGVRSCKFLILTSFMFFEILRAAEVVLGSGSANCGILLVAVHV